MRNEMLRKVLLLFILVSYVVSDYCVRYTFEENFNELFTNERGPVCVNMPPWQVGKYSALDLTDEQNERSTSFIMPLQEYSCVSSFIFPITDGGTIEVTIYMEATDTLDQITLMAFQLDRLSDRFLGVASNSAWESNFVPGWHTLKITLHFIEADIFGYISIMGMASPNSIVLVDSFRYIPPGMEESACRLYEDEPTVPPTPEPTTPEPASPEVTTTEPTTPDVTTPEPTTPEVTTPEPTTPEVTTPEPTTLEVTTPDSTTPEVTTPEPTTPEMTTPDSTTPEVTKPEPPTPEATTPEPTTTEVISPDPTTPEVTTPEPTTLELTTPELTTPEVITPDPTTPEVTSPEPTTAEVTSPEPTTLEVPSPDPTTPEVTTPELTTPEVTTSNPTMPEVTAPEPTTPDVTTPDPTTPEEATPENKYRYLLTIEMWVKTSFGSKTI